jgi:lipoprotein-anchoring transpeptidase ErfK/SrfK
MIAREREQNGRVIPAFMKGGVGNPLGARALYLFNTSGDTQYRIHGTSEPWTIGHNVSSGCIRLVNADVEDLYTRAKVGAKVIVL